MSTSNESTLKILGERIEELYQHFRQIRTEAAGIATHQMPDAALHLNDVLQATEEATITILEATGAIGACAAEPDMPPALRERIDEQVSRIYEASSFQDISGQRIQKVLRQLSELESQLHSLSQMASAQAAPAPQADSLMNGPALAALAPSQAEIDQMFRDA